MWTMSSDIHEFLAEAGAFLQTDPISHTVLLTEAAYLAARRSSGVGRYGWWRTSSDRVAGAFLQAPRHSAVLSTTPSAAVSSLVDAVPSLPPVDVDGRQVDEVLRAWHRVGISLRERARIRLYRLGHLRAPHPPSPPSSSGQARLASFADRELLISWYARMMAAVPDDPSDVSYLVDDPLDHGGIMLWSVEGEPVAMAGRSRLVAGMVRLGAVFAAHDDRHGEAAFIALCRAAAGIAHDVLVFAAVADATADAFYRRLGFEPVRDRVILGPP